MGWTLEKYRELATKYPNRKGNFADRAIAERGSIVLGRDFGEDFDDFLARRPDQKERWDDLAKAIAELRGDS